ncbi:MAG: SBBP repeat-containing protein [Bacteroidetes bacterium]|nr:SBBP repeat-containing protein [Bacteroidota bacterium]
MYAIINKRTVAVVLILTTIVFNVKSQTKLIWGKQLGTTKAEYAMNHVIDQKGNIYISGKTTGNMDGINYGKNDGFITKIDDSGNTLWTRQFGTKEDEDEQWSAIDTKGCVYITGSTTGELAGKNQGKEDVFVVKYNPEGKMIWSKQFGSDSTDIGKGIFVDKKGFVYITGITGGKLGQSRYGKSDGFLMKLDQNGKLLFIEQFGSASDDYSNAITGDNKGNIYVCGSTFGDLATKNKGFMDAFTGQFTDDGKLVKFNQFGSEGFEITMNLLVDKEKNIYVCGSTSGDFGCKQIGEGDCFLTKINDKGEIVWNKQFGTAKHDGIRGITFNEKASDNILVSGLLSLPPAQAFIRMYKKDGSLVWEKKIIDEEKGDTSGKDVSIDDKGSIYQLGLTMSNLFGSLIGESDMYLVKLNLDKN